MSSHLIESLATTPELADVFSDRSLLQAMLDFRSRWHERRLLSG